MSPEGWADHSLTEVIFSTLPAFNVIDLARLDVLANSVGGKEHCWNFTELKGARLLMHRCENEWEGGAPTPKTERNVNWAVKAGKWYPRLCVPYFSTGNSDVFWWYPIYSDGCGSATMTSMIWWQTATTTAPSVRTPSICIFQPKRVIHKRCNISLWNHQFHKRGHKIAINLTSNNSCPPRPPTRKGTRSSSAEITTC